MAEPYIVATKSNVAPPPVLSVIPLFLVAAPKDDTGSSGIPDCRQLEHPVTVVDVRPMDDA
jgi:hypothetical protein